MMLYVVKYTVGGYAREDAAVPQVAGVYTDPEVARKVSLAVQGAVQAVELDFTNPGIVYYLKEIGVNL